VRAYVGATDAVAAVELINVAWWPKIKEKMMYRLAK